MENYIGWRPVVAVFVTICFLVTDIVVLSDSIVWFNKLGVNVGIILIYFFEIDFSMYLVQIFKLDHQKA